MQIKMWKETGNEADKFKTKMAAAHWNCASSLCLNSWRTKIPGLKFYSLRKISSNDHFKREYIKILKNDNINWRKAKICSEHWSAGKRENLDDIPDVVSTRRYLEKIEKSKFTKDKAKKVTAVKQTLHDETQRPKKKRRILQYKQSMSDIDCDNSDSVVDQLREQLKKKNKEIEKLQAQVDDLLQEKKLQGKNFDKILAAMKRGQFLYVNLKEQPSKFFDLTGLSVEEFDCLYDCVQPFVHLICYPDGKTDGQLTNNRKLDLKTELMTFFTVSRHSLHLSVMAWITQCSQATISRCFCAWAVFLCTLFDCLNLHPLHGFVQAFLPKVFEDAGFAETEVLGDATESWIAQSENFEVNNITFSNYKNHTTGKTSVWIYPHGGLLCCSDTYPGTISDKDITEQCWVLDNVNKGKVVLTDKGFDIAEVCLKKGVLHNRPPMKFSEQYEQSEISVNFDIATLRVYNENYIGRMRDWTILNSCWPMTRIDLLGHCFKVFAHIVNILKTPVGPKESS